MSVSKQQLASVRPFELDTPEHVSVGFVLGDLGNRFAALLVDLAVILGGLFVIVLLAGIVFAGVGFEDPTAAVIILAAFLLRNFYFTASEIFGRGRTLGKRLLRLRVIARDGGPLTAEQVFARNLTRDIETFLPLSWMLAPASLAPGVPWWINLAMAVWILGLALVPFFNRQRARLGDLVAGTVVVAEPEGELLADLLAVKPGRAVEKEETEEVVFTREQLDIYGIRELQVLEEVLRREASQSRRDLLREISRKVRAKIGWDAAARVDDEAFLRAFYGAQRQKLEQKMLFGERREKKRW